MAKLAEIGQTW